VPAVALPGPASPPSRAAERRPCAGAECVIAAAPAVLVAVERTSGGVRGPRGFARPPAATGGAPAGGAGATMPSRGDATATAAAATREGGRRPRWMSSINIRRVSSSSTSSSNRSLFGRNGWEPAAARMRPSGGADMNRLQYVQYVYKERQISQFVPCAISVTIGRRNVDDSPRNNSENQAIRKNETTGSVNQRSLRCASERKRNFCLTRK
jgi:hypothetical protein